MRGKEATIECRGIPSPSFQKDRDDYISLTDMVKHFGGKCPHRAMAEKQGHGALPRSVGANRQPGF